MAQEASALALSLAGVGVSTVYQVRHGNDPIPVIVIGSIWTGIVVGIAAVNPDVGTALAAVFFLGMFLTRGSEIIDVLSEFASSSHSSSNKKVPHHG